MSHRDDPGEHQGRTRGFAHERGQWATHVHIRVPVTSAMRSAVDATIDAGSAALGATLTPLGDTELHVSLSRPFPIRDFDIEPVVAGIRRAIAAARVAPFLLSFDSTRLFGNDDGTRVFLALAVDLGEASVLRLIDAVDTALSAYGLPVYYTVGCVGMGFFFASRWMTQHTPSLSTATQLLLQDPCAHASIAWVLTSDVESLEKATADATAAGEDGTGAAAAAVGAGNDTSAKARRAAAVRKALPKPPPVAQSEAFHAVDIRVDSIEVKTGNKVSRIALSRS